MNIITQKMVFGGNSLTKINGKNVFIPYALPNEQLEIEITLSKRDYDEAKIIKILEPSEYRVKPICPLYEKCGGCNMMHIEENYQRKLKIQLMEEAFKNNGIELPEVETISGKSTGYRARFQLTDGGLNEKHSNNIIKIQECPIAEDKINDYLKQTPFEKRPKGRTNIFASQKILKVGNDEEKKVCITTEENFEKKNKDNIEKTALLQKKNKNIKQLSRRYSGTFFSEQNTVTLKLLDKTITFDARGFFQSNLEVLEKSIEKICYGIKGKNALDMYAGCGVFSVFLKDNFKKVTLVEHNRDAITFAEQNMQGKNHASFGLSGKNWVLTQQTNPTSFDACVIDPPRSGIEKEVLEYLCKSKIPVIHSVSCDIATNARDIAKLIKVGYKIEKAYMLDFYPNTSHIESLICLRI